MAINPNDTQKRWYVLLTEPRRERLAAAGLIARRVDVYLPEFPVRRRHGRKMRQILVPLLPGYLLAPFDPANIPMSRIHATLGLRASGPLMKVDGRYTIVPQHAIAIVQAKEARLCKTVSERPGAFHEGDPIEVTDGPFAWFRGAIEDISKLDTQGRIGAAISLFGRLVSIELEASQIRAA